MFRRLNRLAGIVKADGIIAALKWFIITVYHRLIPQKQVIWCTDLTEFNAEGFSLPDNIEIQRFYSIDKVDKEDLKTLIRCGTDLMGSAASKLIPERFNKGAILWLYKENRILVGYRWTIVNNHVTPTYVPHTKTDVHSIGEEIFPAFRGKNLHQLAMRYVRIISKNEGFTRYYSETYLWNKRAIKSILKSGTRPIGIATRFSIFGKNIVIWHDMTSKKNFL